MANEIDFARCGQCDRELDEAIGLALEDRQPCPECGSKSRNFGKGLNADVTMHSTLGYKARHPGPGKPFVEGKVGSDLHRKTGRWMHLERVIDRARDWYRERISDPHTGEVIRDVEEPLSQHRGRGSAKKQPDPPQDDAE